MLAFGVTLLVSVAATPPPATSVRAPEQKLASTYDEAACDASDGGECAVEILVDLPPAPPAILDCESPLIADMIGSCDLPAPTIPSLHLPTLQRGGNGITVAFKSGSGERISIVSFPPSLDAAIPMRRFALAPSIYATPLSAGASTLSQDAPRSRLDRPPRV